MSDMSAQEALAAVRALADEWDVMAASHASPAARVNIGRHADALRAVLGAAGVEPTPAECACEFGWTCYACREAGTGYGGRAAPVDAVSVGVTDEQVVLTQAEREELNWRVNEDASVPVSGGLVWAVEHIISRRLAAAPVGGPDLAELGDDDA